MRGTLKGFEVERWGGEQARRDQAGSLNPSKTSTSHTKLSRPASALGFFLFERTLFTPRNGVCFLRSISWGDAEKVRPARPQ